MTQAHDAHSSTQHIDDDRLYSVRFDHGVLSALESAHLQGCTACATLFAELGTLATSLAIAGRSLPSADALAKARALAATIPVSSPIARLSAWVRATLAVDTRSTAAAGTRSMGGAYRLLYTTLNTDVEISVLPVNGSRRVEGEILPAEANADPGTGLTRRVLPALVQLTRSDGAGVSEVETNLDGRFRIDHVAPGAYRLWIAFLGEGDLVIEELEIA